MGYSTTKNLGTGLSLGVGNGTNLAVVSPSGSTNTNASAAYLAGLGIDMGTAGTTAMNSTATSGSTGLVGAGQSIKPVTSTLSSRDQQTLAAASAMNKGLVDSTTGLTKTDIRNAYKSAQLDNFMLSDGKSGFTFGNTSKDTKIIDRVWNQLTSSEYNQAYDTGYSQSYDKYYNEGYRVGRETKQQVGSALNDWGHGFVKAADSVVDFFQNLGGGDTGIDALDILTANYEGQTMGANAAQLADANLAKWTFGANLWNQVVYSMTQNIADTALTMVTMGTGGLMKSGIAGAVEGVKAATGHSLVNSLMGRATNLSLAIMALRVIGDEYQNNLLNNPFASTQEALGNALIKAAIEFGTEKMSAVGAIGAQGSAMNEGIIDELWSGIGNLWGEGTLMATMTAGFLGEGFEEIVAQFANDIVNQAYYHAGSELGTEQKWSSFEDYALAGLAGGISGAIGAGSKWTFAHGTQAGATAFENFINKMDRSPNAVEEALGATESPVKTQVAAAAAQQSVMQQRAAEYQAKVAEAQKAFLDGAQHGMQIAAELHNAGIQYRQVIEEIEKQYKEASPEEAKSLFQKLQDARKKAEDNQIALDIQRNMNKERTARYLAQDKANFETIHQLSKKYGDVNVQNVLRGNESNVDAETALAIQYALANMEQEKAPPQEMKRGTKEQQQQKDAEIKAKDEEAKKKAAEKAKDLTRKTETKPTETKPTETKPAETKPAETKPVENKPTEPKKTNLTDPKDTTLKEYHNLSDFDESKVDVNYGKEGQISNMAVKPGKAYEQDTTTLYNIVRNNRTYSFQINGETVVINAKNAKAELDRRLQFEEAQSNRQAPQDPKARRNAKADAVLAEAQKAEDASKNKTAPKSNTDDRDALTGKVVTWDPNLQLLTGTKNFREYCTNLSTMTKEQLQEEARHVKDEPLLAPVVEQYMQRRDRADAKAAIGDVRLKSEYKQNGERWCRNKLNEFKQNSEIYEKEIKLLKEVMEENGWPLQTPKKTQNKPAETQLPVAPTENKPVETPAAPVTSQTPAAQTSNSTQTVEADAKLKRSIARWGEGRCRTEYAKLIQNPEANKYELELIMARMEKLGIDPEANQETPNTPPETPIMPAETPANQLPTGPVEFTAPDYTPNPLNEELENGGDDIFEELNKDNAPTENGPTFEEMKEGFRDYPDEGLQAVINNLKEAPFDLSDEDARVLIAATAVWEERNNAKAQEITSKPPEGATPNLEQSHKEQVAEIMQTNTEIKAAKDAVLANQVQNNSIGEVTYDSAAEERDAIVTRWIPILEEASYYEEDEHIGTAQIDKIKQTLEKLANGTYNIRNLEDRETLQAIAARVDVDSPTFLKMCEEYVNTTSPFSAYEEGQRDPQIDAWLKYKEAEEKAGRIPTSCAEWIAHNKAVKDSVEKGVENVKKGADTREEAYKAAKEALKDKEIAPEVVKNLVHSPFAKMLVDIAIKKGYVFYSCKVTDTLQAFRDSGFMQDKEWAESQTYFSPDDKTMGLTAHNGKYITLDIIQIRNKAMNENFSNSTSWRKMFPDKAESTLKAIENVISHECIHTMIDPALSKPISKKELDAGQRIEQIYNAAKAEWNNQFKNADKVYAFVSPREFLCELSNPIFRSWLANNICGENNIALSKEVQKLLQANNIALNERTLSSFLAQVYATADIIAESTSRSEIQAAVGESPFFFSSSQYLGWTTDIMDSVMQEKRAEWATKREKENNVTKYQSEQAKKEQEKLDNKTKAGTASKARNGVFSNLQNPFQNEKIDNKNFVVRNEKTGRSIYYANGKARDEHTIEYYVFETRMDDNGQKGEICIAKIRPGKDAYGNAVRIMKGSNNFHYTMNLNVDPYSIAELTPKVLDFKWGEKGRKNGRNPVIGSTVVADVAMQIQNEMKRLIDEYSGKKVDMTAIAEQAINSVQESNPAGYEKYLAFVSAGAIDIKTAEDANLADYGIEFDTEYGNGDVATVDKVWDELEGEYKYANRTPVKLNFIETTELAERDTFEAAVNALIDNIMVNGVIVNGEHFSFQTATANDLKHKKMRLLSSELIGNGIIPNLRQTVAELEEKVNNRTATAAEYEKYRQAKTQLELNAGLDWEQINKTGSKTLTNKGVGQTGSDSYSYIQAEERKREEAGEEKFRVFNGEGKLGEAIVIRDIFQQFSEQLMGVDGDQVGKLQTNPDGSPNISGNWKEAQDGMGLTDGSTFQMRADAMGHKGVLCRADNWQRSIQVHGRETLEKLNTTTLYTDEFGRIYTDEDVEQLKAQEIEYWPMMGYNENKTEVGLYDVWGTWQSLNMNQFTGKQVHHLLTESMVKFAGSYKGSADYYRWVGDKDIRVIPKENIYGSGFEDSVMEGLTEEQMQLKSVRKLAIRQTLRGMEVTDAQLEEAMSNTEKFCKDILADPKKQVALIKGSNKTVDALLESHPQFLNSAFCKQIIERKLNRIRNAASYSTILTPAEQRQYSWILADPINILSYLCGEVTDTGFAKSEEAKREQLGDITEMPAKYQGTSIPVNGLAGDINQRRLSVEEANAKNLDREKIVAPEMVAGESAITRSPTTSMHDVRPVMNDKSSFRKAQRQYDTTIDRDIVYVQLNSSLMQRLDNDFDGDTATLMQDAAIVKIIMDNVKLARDAGTDNVTAFPHGKGKKMSTTMETLSYSLKACMHDAGVGKYDTYLDRIYASNWLPYRLQEEYAAVAAAGYILATDYTKTGYMPESFLKYVNTMVDILNAKVDVDTTTGNTFAMTRNDIVFMITKDGQIIQMSPSDDTGDAFKKTTKDGSEYKYETVAPSPEYYRYGNSRKRTTWMRTHKPKGAKSQYYRQQSDPDYTGEAVPTMITNKKNKFSNKVHEYSLGIGNYGKDVEKNKFAWNQKEGNWFKISKMETGYANKISFRSNDEDSVSVVNSLLIDGKTKGDILKPLFSLGDTKNELDAIMKTYLIDATDYEGYESARAEFARKHHLGYVNGNFIYEQGGDFVSIPEDLSIPKKMSRLDERFWTGYLGPCYELIKNKVGDTATAINTLTAYLLNSNEAGFQSILYSHWGDFIQACRNDNKVYDPIAYMQDIFNEAEIPNFAKTKAQIKGRNAYVETEYGEPMFSAFEDSETDDLMGEVAYFDEDGNPASSMEDWASSLTGESGVINLDASVLTDDGIVQDNGRTAEEEEALQKLMEEMGNEELPNPFDTEPTTPPTQKQEAPKETKEEKLKRLMNEPMPDDEGVEVETTSAPDTTSTSMNENVETEETVTSGIKEKMNNANWVERWSKRIKAIKVHSMKEGSEERNLSQEHLEGLTARLEQAFNGKNPKALVDYFREITADGQDNYLNFIAPIKKHIDMLGKYYDLINDANPSVDDVARYRYQLQATAEVITAHYEQMVKSQNVVRNIQNELTQAMKNSKYRWLFGKEGKGTVGKFVSKHIVEQLSPGSLFRVLSGMNKNSEAYKFGVAMEKADLLRGQMLGFYSAGLTNMLEELGGVATKDKKAFVRQIEETRNEKTDFHGLTKGDVLNLYMAIKDDNGWFHLNNAGFEDGEGKIIKCNGKKGNPTVQEVKMRVNEIVNGDEVLSAAAKMMRNVLDSYAPFVSYYRETYLGKLADETVVKENYWIDRTGKSQDNDSVIQDDNVQMMDDFISMQSRMYDPEGCIMRIDAFESFNQYCNSAAKSCSYGAVQYQVYNMSSKAYDNAEDYSLLNFLDKNGFASTVEYMQDLSNDLSGNKKNKDPFFTNVLSNFANSVLTGSIQTAVRQKASFWNALAQIPMEYLNKYWGLTSLDSTKFTNDARIKALAQYSGVIEMRRGDVDRVTSLRENIKRNMGEEVNLNEFGQWIAEKTPEFMQGMIPGVDVQTTCRIAFACWDYVRDQKAEWKGLSTEALSKNEDFMRAYASKVEEVVPLTQPMYGMMFRSQVQRSTGVQRTMLMFRTQQGRNFNQLVEGYFNKEFNGDDTQFKMACYGLGLSAVTYSALGLLGTIIKGKADKWDEDDDGYYDLSAVLKQLVKGTASAVYTTDWLGTFVGDYLLAAFTGDRYYGFEANGVAQMNDLASNSLKAISYIGDGKWGKAASATWDTILSGTQLAGIPLENAINTFLAPIRVTMTAAEIAGLNRAVEQEAAARGIDYTSPTTATIDNSDIVLSAVAEYNTKLAYEERAEALLAQHGITSDTKGYSQIRSTVITKLKEQDEATQKASIPRATATGNTLIDEAIAEDDLSNYYKTGAEALLAQNGITPENTSNYNSIRSSVIQGLKEMDKPQKTQALPTGNSVIDSAITASNTTSYYSDAATALMNAYGMTKDNTENYSTIHSQIVTSLKQMDKDQTEYLSSGLTDVFSTQQEYFNFKGTVDANGNNTITQTELRTAVNEGSVSKDYANAYWDAMVKAGNWSATTSRKF